MTFSGAVALIVQKMSELTEITSWFIVSADSDDYPGVMAKSVIVCRGEKT